MEIDMLADISALKARQVKTKKSANTKVGTILVTKNACILEWLFTKFEHDVFD